MYVLVFIQIYWYEILLVPATLYMILHILYLVISSSSMREILRFYTAIVWFLTNLVWLISLRIIITERNDICWIYACFLLKTNLFFKLHNILYIWILIKWYITVWNYSLGNLWWRHGSFVNLVFFVFTDDEDDIDTSDLISGLQREVDLMDLAIKRERLQSLVDSDPITKSKFTTVGKAHHLSCQFITYSLQYWLFFQIWCKEDRLLITRVFSVLKSCWSFGLITSSDSIPCNIFLHILEKKWCSRFALSVLEL